MTTWLSVTEASREAGVGADTVRRWCNNGRLPSIRTDGGHRRIDAEALVRLLRDGSAQHLGLTKDTRDLSAVFDNWTDQIDSIRPFVERSYDTDASLERALMALVGTGKDRRGGLLEALEGLVRDLEGLCMRIAN